ncbi:hypothetical protein CQ14_26300 [Bradyrhizobium lablabi]|uniref:PXPV repeat-containing protein n=1 Tax=Bradyrhizobium lablabi TaxID=722472 RepID=A0A0R3MLU4_9BRAD|nr:hypothetical protein [Bradyrhizobium lablabi]KRR20812.1 hypothetical protein CQ14_26300 [Bradyrhizobium lablabi]
MYRSSLALGFVALCSASAAASDLSSVYVAPGGVYAPSSNVYVRPGAAYRQPAYVEPGYGYRSYEAPPPVYRAPAAVYGEYGYPAQPAYVERVPAYPERYYGPERDYALEYAPRPPLPVPYRARARCDDGYGRWSYCD